jgi:NADH-quinone oxidoreductase subunit G
MAAVPGALSAVAALAEEVGASVAWVPRRAGERGAIEAGALPGLLPGGRPVEDDEARTEVARAWSVATLPERPGRDTAGILDAAIRGELGALLVGGVDADDLPDPTAALAAIDAVPFLVSLELRASSITDRADVVLPVAPVVEKAGTFLTWEGRHRPFEAALPELPAMPDVRVLHVLADAMDVQLGLPDVARARREIGALGPWAGERPAFRYVPGGLHHPLERGQAVLATWHELLDAGRLQDNEEHLAGTARRPVARMSVATAQRVGATDRDLVTVSSSRGSVTLPLVVSHHMADDVVWLPTNARGCAVRRDLAARAGDVVWVDSAGSRGAAG